jgi:hypothetical protein
MKTVQISSMFFFAAFFCGCQDTAQAPAVLPPGAEGHVGAGVLFPDSESGFTRLRIRTYDDKGLDVSAAYNNVDFANPISVTVYVYPAPPLTSVGSPDNVIEGARKMLMDNHFEGVKAGIIEEHPSATLVTDDETSMDFQGQSLYGRSATFNLQERFAGIMQPVNSRADIFSFGEWLIKFRISHPASSNEKAQKTIDEFMNVFCEANARIAEN